MPELDVPSGHPARVPTPSPGDPRLARLSLNQKTVSRLGVTEAVELCRRHGVPAIGLWREPVAEHGLAATAKLVAGAGLRVSSLCRGGFLTGTRPAAEAHADNRRAIEEAATLGTDTLVLVVGGLPAGSTDLAGARQRVVDGVGALLPAAEAAGVRLALEPMHPLFCADRGVLSTIGQALEIAERFPAGDVGVLVDSYHVWWDPELPDRIARAGAAGRIAGYQVGDWILPLPTDTLLGRGMMGDGHIDLPGMTAAVRAGGYAGDTEVELFNADIWSADPDAVIRTVLRRYVTDVLGDDEV